MIKYAIATALLVTALVANLGGAYPTAAAMPKAPGMCGMIEYCLTESPTYCGMSPAQRTEAGTYYAEHC